MMGREQYHQDPEAPADSIIGTWTPAWSIGDGEPTSAEDLRDITLTFAGGCCEVRRAGKVIRLGTYTADSTTSPRTLDVCFTESDVPELIRSTLLGIYEMDANRLRICYGSPGGARASSFCGDRGTGQYLAEYRRMQ